MIGQFSHRCGKRFRLVTVLIAVAVVSWSDRCGVAQTADGARADVGQFYELLKPNTAQPIARLSYLAKDWRNVSEWRDTARDQFRSLLAYSPEPCPLNAEVVETVQKDGYRRLLVRYSVTRDRRTEAYLLLPDKVKNPAPAIVAIHDHGGFYYFGKEKITQTESPPEVLKKFVETYYGGRSYADELAKRGFVVLVPDGFYFGSQRLDPAKTSDLFVKELRDLDPKSDDYIRAFNKFASTHETLMAKTIFTAGATWPGILFHGDRAAVDYLLTRPEVDPQRIGCIGLSIGGFRAAHLGGIDSRVRATVVAGWMTTYESLLRDHLRSHTWMIYVPGQFPYLDLPDVASLTAPNPLLIINCSRDALFTMDGMKDAESKLRTIYQKLGHADRFDCRFYDEPHCLNVTMQNDAFDWLERSLSR